MLTPPVSETDHFQGDASAPIVLVEFGDYECPHCGHAYPIVKQVQKHFGAKLAFVFRNFPLAQIHPTAEIAAESTEFAATRGKYWEMHDAIFENQRQLSLEFLLELAATFKLDDAELSRALQSDEFHPRVRKDFTSGVRSGVNGTPTFFINGQRHDAAFEFEDLVAAIEAALAGNE